MLEFLGLWLRCYEFLVLLDNVCDFIYSVDFLEYSFVVKAFVFFLHLLCCSD